MYDSLKILGLGFGATEAELKHSFRKLSRVYHPDKHKPEETGLSLEEATAHFQLLNNAYSYLREKIWCQTLLQMQPAHEWQVNVFVLYVFSLVMVQNLKWYKQANQSVSPCPQT